MNRYQQVLIPRVEVKLLKTLLILGLSGCGIEVGNPSKPRPEAVVALDDQILLQMSAAQHDTAVYASLDQFRLNSAQRVSSLALRKQGDGDARCREDESSLVLKREDAFSKVQGLDSRPITDRIEEESEVKLDVQGTIACPTDPEADLVYNWSLISSLSGESKEQRIRIRTQDGQSISSKLETVGKKTFSIQRLSLDSSTVSLRKQIDLRYDAKLEGVDANGQEFSDKSRLETLDGNALVVEEVLDAAGLRKEFTLVSGGVALRRNDGSRIELIYQNLSFSNGDNCQPLAGEIKGQVWQATSSASPVSFVIRFDGKGAKLEKSDGYQAQMVLESCRLNLQP